VCIAIPALVTSMNGSEAVAEVGGQPRQINVSLTPEVEVGDYVILRNGYATTVLSDQEAFEILELLEELARAGQ
jgi:hydrogenase expression/formation protein HypC